MFDVTTAARRNDFRIDHGAGLRESLEGLLLHDGVGLDARMRHAISAVVHLAVDAPLGVPEDAEEFLGRLDASWLFAAWNDSDQELSLLNTLAGGEVPALSWCELMFTTTLAPWSGAPAAVHARRIFGTGEQARLAAVSGDCSIGR
ncbi:hypothetical protein [Nocardia sp. CDC160]|uniref:hypothetical protein n=1 Tax=Nocardia sp. CDC160 TaxID=3112166 RepID=UPI002DBC97D7|nr:hypothetical protein [Nocardia sp. CDC160]MEC3916454.1 hypothetical protein [Nocardia sp. CDC160]